MKHDDLFDIQTGDGPLVATAVHDGHEIREELRPFLAISEADRLREEDPFTSAWTTIAPNRIIAKRSRFEVDLNRPPERAVYRTPEDAWGLQVWKDGIPDDCAERSMAEHEAFYETLEQLYSDLQKRYSRFVVFDLHAYNHRRQGPDGPIADPEGNPQVNLGTRSVGNRAIFGPLIERFVTDLGAYPFPGGNLDVRENVKFYGLHHPQWTHARFPDSACVLAVEFKKFFMDEWTGAPYKGQVEAIRDALTSTIPGVLEELARLA